MAIFRTAFLIAVVAVSGACLAPQTIGTQELVGTEWRLVEMDDIPVVTGAEKPFFLAFGRDGKLSGQACNHQGGEYRLQGQRMTIELVAMSEMSCGEAIDRMERRFLQIISEPLAYQFAPRGDLLLGDLDRPALRLLQRAANGSSTIVTGQWGGRQVGLFLGAAGGNLEYDCASGRIEGPLSVDSDGRFTALGYHTPGEGGPERQGHVLPRLPAVYSGRVWGDVMTLLVRVPSVDLEIGPLSLQRNAQPIILRCL